MNNSISITVRVFPVTVRDERTGAAATDSIVLTRQQLQAAQVVGESSTELIYRIFNRKGYRVLEIGKAVKRDIPVELYINNQSVYIGGSMSVVEAGA